jgi:hypothetical protein
MGCLSCHSTLRSGSLWLSMAVENLNDVHHSNIAKSMNACHTDFSSLRVRFFVRDFTRKFITNLVGYTYLNFCKYCISLDDFSRSRSLFSPFTANHNLSQTMECYCCYSPAYSFYSCSALLFMQTPNARTMCFKNV